MEWAADTVCVFDGLQNVLERCEAWYEDRLNAEKAGELVREDAREHGNSNPHPEAPTIENGDQHVPDVPTMDSSMPDGIHLFTAEPITDRKSAFVGRACRISHPSEVGASSRTLRLSFLNYDYAPYKGPARLSTLDERPTDIPSGTPDHQRMAMSGWKPTAPRWVSTRYMTTRMLK